ncbi:hypothetical protein Hanom_Chr08g00733231 [Helianthus anomalus]
MIYAQRLHGSISLASYFIMKGETETWGIIFPNLIYTTHKLVILYFVFCGRENPLPVN